MNTIEIISAIDEEITKLHQVRSLLSGYSDPTSATVKKGRPKKTAPVAVKPVKTAKRVMSAEGKARIAAAQKKRWAAHKKAAK